MPHVVSVWQVFKASTSPPLVTHSSLVDNAIVLILAIKMGSELSFDPYSWMDKMLLGWNGEETPESSLDLRRLVESKQEDFVLYSVKQGELMSLVHDSNELFLTIGSNILAYLNTNYADLNTKYTNLEKKMDTGFAKMDTKYTNLEKKITELPQELGRSIALAIRAAFPQLSTVPLHVTVDPDELLSEPNAHP